VTLLKGLKCIHDTGYTHRDIKPENIMINKRFEVKYIDLGFAAPIERSHHNKVCGTPYYIAPESANGVFTEKSDLFSLGMVFLMMATKCTNYLIDESSSESEIIDDIARGTLKPYIEGTFSAPVKSLITKMTLFNASFRPTDEQALQEAENMKVTFPIHHF
ncbi:MAG: protein kinase, partial [Coxiellaceae bacterium]|nr:protein kinase [Coxiellaceae bacterium]